MVLNESFLNALAEKPLAKITVKEICEGADINRSTYYTYFSDPFDQLEKIKTEILVDMTVYVDEIIKPGAMNREEQRRLLEQILEYMKSRQHVFGILLESGGDFNFQREILTFFGQRLFPEAEKDPKPESVEQYKYTFAGTGAFGMIFQWIEQGCQTEVHEMASMIADFTDGLRI